jgi:hypothetical protein
MKSLLSLDQESLKTHRATKVSHDESVACQFVFLFLLDFLGGSSRKSEQGMTQSEGGRDQAWVWPGIREHLKGTLNILKGHSICSGVNWKPKFNCSILFF